MAKLSARGAKPLYRVETDTYVLVITTDGRLLSRLKTTGDRYRLLRRFPNATDLRAMADDLAQKTGGRLEIIRD